MKITDKNGITKEVKVGNKIFIPSHAIDGLQVITRIEGAYVHFHLGLRTINNLRNNFANGSYFWA